jgi:uncharacterized membrane protein
MEHATATYSSINHTRHFFSIQQNLIAEDYLLVHMRDNWFKNIYTFLYITLESVNYLQIRCFFSYECNCCFAQSDTLGWPTLADRHLKTRLIMCYKITHIGIPTDIFVPSDNRLRKHHSQSYQHIQTDNWFKNIYTFLYITLESVNYLQIRCFFSYTIFGKAMYIEIIGLQ